MRSLLQVMLQLKFLLHLAVIVLDGQIWRYISIPNVDVSKLLTGETIWLADNSLSSNNNNAFTNTTSTCNGKLRNEVVWTEGLKTPKVAQLVKKFPHIPGLLISTTEFISHLRPKNIKTTTNCILKLSIPRIFFVK